MNIFNKIAYCVYADTQPNPSVRNVEDALAVYHAHQCSGLVAIGGGSAMDCAKAVGARVAYPKRTVNQLGGKPSVSRAHVVHPEGAGVLLLSSGRLE